MSEIRVAEQLNDGDEQYGDHGEYTGGRGYGNLYEEDAKYNYNGGQQSHHHENAQRRSNINHETYEDQFPEPTIPSASTRCRPSRVTHQQEVVEQAHNGIRKRVSLI